MSAAGYLRDIVFRNKSPDSRLGYKRLWYLLSSRMLKNPETNTHHRNENFLTIHGKILRDRCRKEKEIYNNWAISKVYIGTRDKRKYLKDKVERMGNNILAKEAKIQKLLGKTSEGKITETIRFFYYITLHLISAF